MSFPTKSFKAFLSANTFDGEAEITNGALFNWCQDNDVFIDDRFQLFQKIIFDDFSINQIVWLKDRVRIVFKKEMKLRDRYWAIYVEFASEEVAQQIVNFIKLFDPAAIPSFFKFWDTWSVCFTTKDEGFSRDLFSEINKHPVIRKDYKVMELYEGSLL